MGGPLSVVISGVFMAKMEKDKVKPSKPSFYKRYIDDIISKRVISQSDDLYDALNSYHPNIKLTAVPNPTEFLDTSLVISNGLISTKVFTKKGKLPTPWKSRVPIRYKRNAISGDLHRSKKISSDFASEITRIKSKYINAGFPIKFIQSVINDFHESQATDTNMIIPNWLFEERKTITIKLPYCPTNESEPKRFLSNLEILTNYKIKFMIIWQTKTIRSIFRLKDKINHKSCVVYEGTCTCGITYTGETERLATLRWKEHEDPRKQSEPSKHLYNFPGHRFTWRVLSPAPKLSIKRKILEAFYISKYKPKLNEQVKSNTLVLFRHGVT